jgi:hypothetical protein
MASVLGKLPSFLFSDGTLQYIRSTSSYDSHNPGVDCLPRRPLDCTEDLGQSSTVAVFEVPLGDSTMIQLPVADS